MKKDQKPAFSENESIVFKANTRRIVFVTLIGMTVFSGYISFQVLMYSISVRAGLLALLSLSLFLVVLGAFVYVLAPGSRFSVVVSSQCVEGVGVGFLRRIIMPIDKINIAQCRPPALLRQGFLKTFDGEIIYLPRYYFNGRDTQIILDEITKRQKEFIGNSNRNL